MRWRIGFDIGGTFTDFILLDTARQEIRLHKCLTTPLDPSVGALEGLDAIVAAAGLTLGEVGEIVCRGWWTMNGYLRQPEENERAIDAAGAGLCRVTAESNADLVGLDA